MNHADIIRLARDAELIVWEVESQDWKIVESMKSIQRFAALIAAPLEEEIKRLRFCIPEGDAAAAMEYLAYCVEKDVAAEREACAKVCEKAVEYNPDDADVAFAFAAAIRARGESK